jgi:hypothetical protein
MKKLCLALAISLLTLTSASGQESQARRAFVRSANGAIGGFATSGQSGSRFGARALGPSRGIGFRAGNFNGPNGGSLQTGGAFAYNRGVGGFRSTGWKGQNANGGSGSGSMTNKYNAQTQAGVKTRNEQLTNAAGNNYGFTDTTNYTKGQGASSVIQTDNHGTYDVNYQRGQAPVVTPASN